NKIQGNNSLNVFLIHFKTGVGDSVETTAESPVTQQIFKPEDKRYYPFTRQVYFHDNEISAGGKSPDSRVTVLHELAAALGGSLPDILYDGLTDPAWPKKDGNPGEICLENNGPATFLDFDAQGGMKHPVKDISRYGCALPRLAAVSIPQAGPPPDAQASRG